MQINYELNAEDIKAFQHYALKKNSTVKKANIFNYLFIGILSYWQVIYLFLFQNFVSNLNWSLLLIYLVSGTITFGFILAISKAVSYIGQFIAINSAVKKYKYGDGVLGEHLLRFENNFIIEATDVNETKHSWKGVDRIEENREYIFIYTTALNAHIIPKRYFRSAQESTMFFDEAIRLKDAANTKFSPSYLAANM